MSDQSTRLLLVDDQQESSEALAAQLQKTGYEVLSVASGQHALDMMDGQKYDLVLVRARMPASEALQVVTRIKGSPYLATPAVVVVDADQVSAAELCVEAGASDFLVLPVPPSLLKTRLSLAIAAGQAPDPAGDAMMLKLEHDLEVARGIQASFLPKELPKLDGWEIAASFKPAREVAGDWYDAFMISQGRRLAFVVADVVDKGVPAALFMALVRSLTRAFAQQNYSLSWTDVLTEDFTPVKSRRSGGSGRSVPKTGTNSLKNAVELSNNYVLENHMELNYFATLFMGMLDPVSGELAYINAGHNPPFIVGSDGAVKAKLKPAGPAVGMIPNFDFQIDYAQINPGDVLYAYTDGVTEARNPAGDFFKEEGLLSVLTERTGSAEELLDRVRTTLTDFVDTAVQFDDITMMAVRRQRRARSR